jgi:hypothetical protein
MNEATTSRREFIRTTTGMLTGLVAAGSPLALIAPGRAWAVDMTAFTSSEAATLVAVARTIAPHDQLEDAAYALVIRSVDSDAAKDAGALQIFREGIGQLGTGFIKAPEAARVAALKQIESSEFFRTMRLKTLQILYASPIAYAYFGYEGEAFSKGGYLERGFNDLRWLPDVPLADSGQLPM